jgi:hypothetical protein
MPADNASEAALAAMYQVTARWFTSEQRLIWLRTTLFVTLNTLVVATLQFLMTLHQLIRLLLPIIGIIYSICWHFSMSRAWSYHSYLIALMREQEQRMKLDELGPFTRGRRISESTQGEVIDGQKIQFPRSSMLFRAKLLADSITWLFAVAYAILFVRQLLNTIYGS